MSENQEKKNKVRRTGNSLVISLPPWAAKEGERYNIVKKLDGRIILNPGGKGK